MHLLSILVFENLITHSFCGGNFPKASKVLGSCNDNALGVLLLFNPAMFRGEEI